MFITTLASLRFIAPHPAFVLHQVLQGLRQFTYDFGGRNQAGQAIYDHSLFELVKVAFASPGADVTGWINRYLLLAAVFMTALFLVRVVRLPRANQLLFLAAASVLLPPVSFDYTLQSLYIPWAWIVLLVLREPAGRDRRAFAVMVLFAVDGSHHLPSFPRSLHRRSHQRPRPHRSRRDRSSSTFS